MRNSTTFLVLLVILLLSNSLVYSQNCIPKDETRTPWKYIPYFDGKDSYININEANASSYNNAKKWFKGDFSLDLWVRPTWPMNGDIDDHYVFFSAGKWDDDHNSLFLYFEEYESKKWRIRVGDGNDSGSNADLFYNIDYSDDFYLKWNHITITFDDNNNDADGGVITLFINGKRIKSKSSFEFNEIDKEYCTIGNGSNHDNDFRGNVSGFRIWDNIKFSNDEVDYIWDRTFNGIETFSDENKNLSDNLVINMFTGENNIYSLVADKSMVEYNIVRKTDRYHPARPIKPYNITATSNYNSISLAWESVSSDQTHYIYRRKVGTSSWGNAICRTNDRSYVDDDSSLNGYGAEYEYRIKTYWYNENDPLNSYGGYYNSGDELRIKKTLKEYEEVRNLIASGGECNGKVVLNWDDLDTPPNSYRVWYSLNGNDWTTLVETVETTGFTHNVDANDLAKDIEYRIDANGDKYNNYSNISTASANTSCTTSPSNVTASINDGVIEVLWDFTQLGAPATGFNIFRKTGTGEFNFLEKVDFTNSYLDYGASSCTDYEYKIEALNHCGSNDSKSITSGNVNMPMEFDDVFTYVDKGGISHSYFDASKGYFNQKVILEWEINPNKKADVDVFEIYRKKTGDNYTLLATINSRNATYYEDVNAEANILYQYKILATGECNSVQEESDELFTTGFRYSSGIISGKITYAGGNAVENVEVRTFSDEVSPGKSIYFNGANHLKAESSTFTNNNIFENPISTDIWIKPESMTTGDRNIFFSISSGIYYVGLRNMKPIVAINTHSINCDDNELPKIVLEGDTKLNANTWYHIATNFDPVSGKLELYLNGDKIISSTYSNPQIPWAAEDNVGTDCGPGFNNVVITYGVANDLNTAYKGNIDEARIWQRFRTEEEIKRDHIRILSGKENGLIAYYRFDENYGFGAYDLSKNGNTFNKNNLVDLTESTFPQWSNSIPSFEQLHPSGVTNDKGNYTITGVRYSGSGNIFNVSPYLGVHEFNPTDKNLFIGDSSPVHNGIDFVDESSFQVTGRITYNNTNIPVKDVFVKIDDNFIRDENNSVVVTDSNGRFDVQVPIGKHYITVEKANHTFASAFYPEQITEGEIDKEYFNKPLSALQFTDNTTVKMSGRVVGGAVESSKSLWSLQNPIKNNLGVAEITISTINNSILDLEEDKSELIISTEVENGSYYVELPPEQYIITSVKIGNKYSLLASGENDAINLSNSFTELYTIDSTLVEGETDLYNIDTVYAYNFEKSWILRNQPQIFVKNNRGGDVMGDEYYIVKNDTIAVVSEIRNGEPFYAFGKPVFKSEKSYELVINGFETYEHLNGIDIDTVVVSDGAVIIYNDCANDKNRKELSFDEKGETRYVFAGGVPNVASPYTHKLKIKLNVSGETVSTWSENPLEAYVMGSLPKGNNFVTKGPETLDFILRDPPGSNSYSYLEKGLTISNTVTKNYERGGSVSAELLYHLGFTLETEVGGIGFAVQTSIENENTIGGGFSVSSEWKDENTETYTIELKDVMSTSNNPDYVGGMGDLFIGHGDNITFGAADFLHITHVDSISNNGSAISSTTIDDGDDSYTIAKDEGLYMGIKLATTFVYTQNHIENYLIPNFEKLRDSFDDIEANSDTIKFYDIQIRGWEAKLKLNEKAKLKSTDKWADYSDFENGDDYQDTNGDDHTIDYDSYKNISFDAGAEYESSVTIDTIYSHTDVYEFNITAKQLWDVGFTYNKSGFHFSEEITAFDQYEKTNVYEDNTTKTVGFVLADENQGDYYSISVKKDITTGFGPVFITEGGQSTCPYEGAETTKYYKPGELISQATMQIEKPRISVNENEITGVPDTEKAVFQINLSNISETDEDIWYDLFVDPASNHDGGIVELDGAPISGNTIAIYIPAGKTINKYLTVEKGQADINLYDSINVVIHSQCQYGFEDGFDNIADTVIISASFVPTCAPVEFSGIYDSWIANVKNEEHIDVDIEGYNLNSSEFKSIYFQYAKPGENRTNQMVFYKDEEDFNNSTETNKELITGTVINYSFPIDALPDGKYNLFLKSVCGEGVSKYEYLTEPKNGIIDRVTPAPFGTPQPSDGILSFGEDISVKFNEEINSGDLYSHVDYVDVRGVLNGTDHTDNPKLLHDASLHFDGQNNYMKVNHVNLDHTDFTIEFWANRHDLKEGYLLSLGNLLAGFDENNHFSIEIDGQTITSKKSFDDINEWAFYSLAYNRGEDNKEPHFSLFILSDGLSEPEITEADIFSSLEGTMYIGYSSENKPAFNGNIHEFRIWNYARKSNEISSQKGRILNGYEKGLYGLWPLNEALGTIAKDMAFGRNADINATWHVGRDGKSIALGGSDYLSIPTGEMVFSNQGDFTVEFWYKTDIPSSDATLFSNGNMEFDANINAWNVYATNTGNIVVNNNEVDITLKANEYLDNNWHHFAMSLSRIGFLSIYIDGNLIKTNSASNFKGFGASELVFGARWYHLAGNDYYDNNMTGNIDEVRVWNSNRTQGQIKRYMNHSLSGSEYGLKAYFPFEDDNNESLLNFTTDTEGKAGDAQIAVQNFSSETPNIKLQRPEVFINHTYIINADEIVIVPTVNANLIENQILNVSIKKIKDLHNNTMASTVNWSVFVDKNQVVWDVQKLQIEKLAEDEKIVKVNIVNKSGANENFHITNIPSWMEVNPSSGSLNPLESKEIEVIIKPQLNIGSYQVDINLVASMEYNERLELDITVNGKVPNWVVDPSNFDLTANIIGQLSIDEILSTDENDLVGCFVNGECRGVSNVQYFANGNMYLNVMNIYSNTNGEEMEFKVYDASSGEIYSKVQPQIVFTANKLYGSVSSPILIKATNYVEQNIDLATGWNWVSFNVYADEFKNLNSVFSNLNTQPEDFIKSQSQFSSVQDNNQWFGSLESLDVSSNYKMKVSSSQDLKVEGYRIIADTLDISISTGWNWISYPLSTQKTIKEAMSSLTPTDDDIIKSQHEFAVYSSVLGWVGSLTFMEPGKGYIIYSNSNGTLNYLSGLGKKSTFVSFNHNSDLSDLPKTEFNMSVIANINIDNPQAYTINAYDINGLCGKAEARSLQNGNTYYFITINSVAPETIHFKAEHKLGVIDANEIVEFKANGTLGSIEEPMELTFNHLGFDNNSDIKILPNPFSDKLVIAVNSSKEEQVVVKVYNSTGMLISQINNLMLEEGYQNVNIYDKLGFRNMANGIYFLKLNINGKEYSEKIIKQ